jgi:hypothetical protein
MRIRGSYLVGSVLCSILVSLGACQHHDGDGDNPDGALGPDACEGIGCSIVNCGSRGLPSTTVSGTVFAPNGTLPLFGVNVYVPISDPGPLAAGAQCDRCSDQLPGGSYVQTTTDEAGHFVLYGVPATASVPLVMQVGKWRRQVTIDTVAACQDNALPATSTTLPRNRDQGDIPQIAIATGDADALDCLVRKLGIDDKEITTDAQGGRVHLFFGNGAKQFATTFTGGTGKFNYATTLWGSVDKLSGYDIVIFSCEGAQNPAGSGMTPLANAKPPAALQAVHDYAGLGGRVFLSHWHNIWVGGEQVTQAHPTATHTLPDWESIATFDFNAWQPDLMKTPPDPNIQATLVDESASKGRPFATWLLNVGASTVRGQLAVVDPRYTLTSVNGGKAERWVYTDPARPLKAGVTGVQDMLFTTPQDQPPVNRCGKVVFSDMHVSADSSSKSGTPYPGGCSTEPLTPQEKALAFIFFDIASCVGTLE